VKGENRYGYCREKRTPGVDGKRVERCHLIKSPPLLHKRTARKIRRIGGNFAAFSLVFSLVLWSAVSFVIKMKFRLGENDWQLMKNKILRRSNPYYFTENFN
jgi:hypothetical protein